ncbi:hypothetical protein [Paraburkholderia bannensis]|uniref:hypothetical protein n=1 Tax=Paraburkholderia bannensis TaxID=765414 RepID=UPI002AB6AB01|nr:hypothetical protein [Paraburkholderia bannensis]
MHRDLARRESAISVDVDFDIRSEQVAQIVALSLHNDMPLSQIVLPPHFVFL